MATEIDAFFTEILVRESSAHFDALIESAQKHSPNARTSKRSVRFPTQVQATLGLLRDPSGDEVAFEVGLSLREDGVLWFEATMFAGQATRLTIAMSSWEGHMPLERELVDVLRGTFSFIGPYAEVAFQRQARAELDTFDEP